ncbi:MAG TPA: TIGR04053 family radical SAM/SPASM domain-containing protein [Bryobacteraceae bacterium]|nr:TIGR04053 family radical SAM/SPASM domain-containing protein [Bryobacteraceae bacterium]
MNFDRAPLLVIWEVTQACDLACVHCRASAMPARNPFELTTTDGFRLLDEVKRFGESGGMTPLMVFTGGDPLKRPDLFEMMRYSVRLGLRTNVSPSATPLLTNEAIDEFKRIGIARMAISLDGASGETHDAFRGIPGTFDRAMIALRHAQKIGLDVQYQTTVTKRNLHELEQIAQIGADVGVKMWSLFFLIVTGRAAGEDDLSGEEYERVFDIIYQISKTAPFDVKTTEAMHYRRYVAQRRKEEMRGGAAPDDASRVAFRTAGVSDAKGFVFVSHQGEVYPSGFLPLSAGNVKRESLVDIYRQSALFRILRDTTLRDGKCGACEYHKLCGGSRSRAYALTGNYLAEDPRCTYFPAACCA